MLGEEESKANSEESLMKSVKSAAGERRTMKDREKEKKKDREGTRVRKDKGGPLKGVW